MLLSLSPGAPSDAQQAGPTPDPKRFEKSVLAYEAADATAQQGNAILLAGDSQFFRWKTFAEDLPATTWSIGAWIRSSRRISCTTPTGLSSDTSPE